MTYSQSWPLSAAQYGIWLGQHINPTNPIYNAGEYIEIHGSIDLTLFKAAIHQTLHEAEALRVRFIVEGDEPRQIIRPLDDWNVYVTDISHEPDAQSIAMAWMHDNLQTSIDLTSDALFTQAVFKLAPDRFLWYQRIHHIAADGFGFVLIAQRVATIYTALLQNKSCDSGAFRSLKQVIDEDQAYQTSSQYEQDRAFWMAYLADRPEPVSLTERPALMAHHWLRQTADISQPEMEGLQEIAGYFGAKWPDIIIAATAIYLHHHTKASELILGLPVMGRLGSVSLRIPSMVMNIVPLPITIQPDMMLADLMQQITHTLREIRPHQRYRYEQLRRDMKLVGGTRRLFGPVINIMPFDRYLRFGEYHGVTHNVSAGPVEDLSINVNTNPADNGLHISFDGHPDCYRIDDLAAHLQGFHTLLTGLSHTPQEMVQNLQVNSLRRKSTGIETFSTKQTLSPSILDGGPLPHLLPSILDRFREQVQHHADKITLQHNQHQVSYEYLLQRAQDIASALINLHINPGALVAIMLPRGIQAIEAILGVLFAGAGYLPIDPEGPEERNTTILNDAKPDVLITTTQYNQHAKQPISHVLELDTMTLSAADYSLVHIDKDMLAYVMYTSGSTGIPNGVMIPHGALASFVTGATERYDITPEDRVLQFAPLHFDASVEELFLTLCVGARLIVRNDEMLNSIQQLLQACAKHHITVLDLPTAFWHELAYSVSNDTTAIPPNLQTIIIGGEAALPEYVKRWCQTAPSSLKLLNTYGPTETTVVATVATLTAQTLTETQVPIGQPLPGMCAVIIDDQGHVVVPGEVGELYLIGDGVSQGYINRPNLNTDRFVIMQQLPGSPRAYRTGDLVQQQTDGQLVFIGRVDHELKISGHRIDPIEIETTLLQYPGIREVAVIGQKLPHKTVLSAYIVTEQPPTRAKLRHHLQSRLPAVMIPTTFIYVEQLPKTPTGKIDRTALQSHYQPNTETVDTLPSTRYEHKIWQVFRDMLGIQVSTQDDFFELGGQSLQAIQIANRLSVAFGCEIPVTSIFRYPTIAELACEVEDIVTKTSGHIGTNIQTGNTLNPQDLGILLPISSRGSHIPLFCMHPAGGISWSYFALAKYLGDTHPIYGLQARGLRQPEQLPKSIAEMARDYLDHVRAVQPQGPYHLLGWSIGGIIAHTMATQLQHMGEEVALLVLLDTHLHQTRPSHLTPEQEALTALLHIAGCDGRPYEDKPYDRVTVRTILQSAGSPLASLSDDTFSALIDVVINNIALAHAASLDQFRGNILFFTAAQEQIDSGRPHASWQAYITGSVHNIDIHCTHPEMIQAEAMAVIGPVVSTKLQEAQHQQHSYSGDIDSGY